MSRVRAKPYLAGVTAAAILCSACVDADEIRPEDGAQARQPIAVELYSSIGGGIDDDLYGVTAVALLEDGEVVVADRTRRLRWYTEAGALIREAGGEGEGPGEFKYIASIHRLPAGGIQVHDPGNQRLTTYDSTGAVLRIESLRPLERGSLAVSGRFSDGSTLVLISYFFSRPGKVGVRRDSVKVARRSESGEGLLSYGQFGGVYWHTATGRTAGNTEVFESYQLPFSGPVLTAVGGDTTWIVQDGGPHLIGFVGDAVAVDTVLPDARRPITPGDIDTWVGGLESPGRAKVMKAGMSDLASYTDRAPYDSLLANPMGWLWLRLEPASPATGQTWILGRAASPSPLSVTFPAGFRALDFGARSVLGVSKNELGLEQVQQWRFGESQRRDPDR